MSTESARETGDHLLWGKEEIGRAINRSPRQAAHLLSIGALPGAMKVGKQWAIPLSRLRKHFQLAA